MPARLPDSRRTNTRSAAHPSLRREDRYGRLVPGPVSVPLVRECWWSRCTCFGLTEVYGNGAVMHRRWREAELDAWDGVVRTWHA